MSNSNSLLFFIFSLFNFCYGLGQWPLATDTRDIDKLKSIDDITEDYLAVQFPFLRKHCVKDALADFLPQCISDGGILAIEDRIKVQTTIKLSICEFENSGLNDWVPRICLLENSDSLLHCMEDLDMRSEWWTTYSGYYQKLNELCNQYSLPFQQEKIVNTFLNLTDIATNVNNYWSNKFEEVMYDTEIEISKYMNNISNFFSDLQDDLLAQDILFKNNVIELNNDLLYQISNRQDLVLDDIDKEWLSINKVLIDEMSFWNTEILSNFNEIDKRLNNTMGTINVIENTFTDLSSIISNAGNFLMGTINLIKKSWVLLLIVLGYKILEFIRYIRISSILLNTLLMISMIYMGKYFGIYMTRFR